MEEISYYAEPAPMAIMGPVLSWRSTGPMQPTMPHGSQSDLDKFSGSPSTLLSINTTIEAKLGSNHKIASI